MAFKYVGCGDAELPLELNDNYGLTLASRIQLTAEQSGIYFTVVGAPDESSTNIGTCALAIAVVPLNDMQATSCISIPFKSKCPYGP